jgi:autotransporter-associated beta strand protein
MKISKTIKICSVVLSLLCLSLGTSLAAGPAGVTDAVLWLDAAQLIGLNNGDTVSSWTDMSGNNNHATLSKGAPKYQTNVLNGQPIMRFTAADMFATANLSAQFPSAATLFIVATINSSGYDLLYTGSAWNEWWRYNGNGYSYPAVFRSPRIEGYCTMPTAGTRLFTVSSSASAWRMSIDGIRKGVASGSYSAGGVQNIPGNANEASPCACDIAEVIEFNRVLTAGEESAVNTYLANKYGLTIDAPHAPGDIYWDNNGSTAGFGTAAGTWAVPTTGDSSQGWSGDPTGSTLPAAFTTAVTNNLRFGSADAGLAAGTVTVSGGVTASNLTFAGSSGGITLTGGTITLADTSSITVNNNATISSVLAGAANSFTKQGSGDLTISGKSTMAGGITVSQGMLINTLGGLRNTSGSVIVSAGATLSARSGWGDSSDGRYEMTNSITLTGTGKDATYGALHGAENFTCKGPITLLTDSRINHGWNNFWLNGPISGTDKNLILQAAYSADTAGLSVNGSMSLGSGALSVIGNGYMYLNAANSFSGGTTVGISGSGVLKLGHVNVLGTGGLTVNSGVVNLNTRSISIPFLSGSGGIITDTGAAGTTTLTVTQSVATTYSGVISNGASRVVALTKTGSGTLTLAGRNTYSGATTINAGSLVGVTGGSCMNSSVIVADGATNGVQVTVSSGQWTCSTLTYSAGTTTLDINFGSGIPSATIAPLRVVGDLNMGTVGICIRNGLWPNAPGIYPLVSYSGVLSGTVPGTALVLPAGLTATIVNNAGSKRIDLEVTAVTWSPSSYNTWTNLVSGNANGSWGTANNWLSAAVADGTNAVADFSTLNITADAFVNNEAPHTVGQLRFGDTSPSHNWNLTNAALTLATTLVQPVIDVSNQTATISSILLGTQGFIKQGSGTLSLSGGNTIAGTIMVSQGVLSAPSVGLRDTSGSVFVSAGAALYLNTGWGQGMANSIFLSGTGRDASRGALHAENNFVCSGPITLLTDSKITHDWNIFYLNSGISGTDKNLELGITVGGQYPIYMSGSVNLGVGALTINSVQNGGSSDGCAVALNAANTYSGGTVLTNYATLRLGNAGALGSGGVTLYPNSKLNLNTFSVIVGALSGPGGIITDWNGAAGTTTLTVNQSTNTTYSGVITNGASRVLALVKSGSGLLTLSATNTYTGATAVSNGTLAVSGALSSSGVTICTGAAFAAGSTGLVGRATLGGTLAFENNSRLLVDVASTTADAASAVGNITLTGTVTLEVSGDQLRGGSWKVLESTGGTITDNFVLAGARIGSTLTKSANSKEIWLNIPRPGTMIRIF